LLSVSCSLLHFPHFSPAALAVSSVERRSLADKTFRGAHERVSTTIAFVDLTE
jgi:hypothetical protein